MKNVFFHLLLFVILILVTSCFADDFEKTNDFEYSDLMGRWELRDKSLDKKRAENSDESEYHTFLIINNDSTMSGQLPLFFNDNHNPKEYFKPNSIWNFRKLKILSFASIDLRDKDFVGLNLDIGLFNDTLVLIQYHESEKGDIYMKVEN